MLREGAGAAVEVFCVKRHEKSGFMGGAIVFPGGKVDSADSDAAWSHCCTTPSRRGLEFADGEPALRALAIAACREAFEEAKLLPVTGRALSDDDLANVSGDLLGYLSANGLKLDLTALVPFARWVTPTVESRRFDARFFLTSAPPGQSGAHDNHETTESFWARPADVLDNFFRGQVQLAPPTERTLELLASVSSIAGAHALANASDLAPVCPELVSHHDAFGETLALALPGDPAHSIQVARSIGKSRFVLREGRWLPEDPPANI